MHGPQNLKILWSAV